MLYNAGVALGRWSIQVFKCERLHRLNVGQLVNMLLWLSVAYYFQHLLPAGHFNYNN